MKKHKMHKGHKHHQGLATHPDMSSYIRSHNPGKKDSMGHSKPHEEGLSHGYAPPDEYEGTCDDHNACCD